VLLLLTALAACRPDGEFPLFEAEPEDEVKPLSPVYSDPCGGGAWGVRPPEFLTAALAVEGSDSGVFGSVNLPSLNASVEGPSADPRLRVEALIERGYLRLRDGDLAAALKDLNALLALVDEVPEWSYRAHELQVLAGMMDGGVRGRLLDGEPPVLGDAAPDADGMARLAAVRELLDEMLAEDPDDLRARWQRELVGVALGEDAMTVPLPVGMPWFDAGGRLGLHADAPAGPARVDDFNGDGLLDLFAGSHDLRQPSRMWFNRGDGSFCDVGDATGLTQQVGAHVVAPADYDNDGDLDLYIGRGGWQDWRGAVRGSLLRNDGGRFTDVTLDAGVDLVPGATVAAAWADVDLDGRVDLLVSRGYRVDGAPDSLTSLYVAKADGSFVDRADALGLERLGPVRSVAWVDYDLDGDADLALTTADRGLRLMRNDASEGFFDASADAGLPIATVATLVRAFDQDGDGLSDLIVAATSESLGQDPLAGRFGSEIGEVIEEQRGGADAGMALRFYRNLGGRFELDTLASGGSHFVLSAEALDLDADGAQDLMFGTGAPSFDAREPAFALRGGDRLTPFHGPSGSLDGLLGLAAADLDEDGDDDLLARAGGAHRSEVGPVSLYENPSQPAGAIAFELRGALANRSAIGARLRLVTDRGVRHRVVGDGGSLRQSFSLTADERPVRLEIAWPAGLYEVYTDIEAGSLHQVHEVDGVVELRPLRPTPLIGAPTHTR
jgi:hypothetical protein